MDENLATPDPFYTGPPVDIPVAGPPARRSNRLLTSAMAVGALALAAGGYLVGSAAARTGSTTQPVATVSAIRAADLAAADLAAADLAAAPTPAPGGPTCVVPRHGVAGTLKAINPASLVVTSAQGSDVTVTTSPATTVSKTAAAAVSDIADGAVVAVHGTSSGQNAIAADQVDILPAGAAPKLGQLPDGPGRFARRGGVAFGTVQKAANGGFTVNRPDGTAVTVSTSSSTKVVKTVEVAVKDLDVGKPIVVSGTVNSDGSVAALRIAQGAGELGFGGRRGFGRPGSPGRGGSGPPANGTTTTTVN